MLVIINKPPDQQLPGRRSAGAGLRGVCEESKTNNSLRRGPCRCWGVPGMDGGMIRRL